jgi:hypothetical protein
MTSRKYSRRQFPLHHTARNRCARRSAFFSSRFFDSSNERPPLQEFDYSDLTLSSELHEQQGKDNISVLVELSEDRILKPLREMSGQRPPAMNLGGWYLYDPNFDGRSLGPGFASAATFGPWVSALARAYAISRDEKIRNKVLHLNRQYAKPSLGISRKTIVAKHSWRVESASLPLTLLPFTAIWDEPYSTYLLVS